MNPKTNDILKFLRNEVVERIDNLSTFVKESGSKPSSQMILDLDRTVAEFKNLVATGAVTLDVLTRMENRIKEQEPDKARKRGPRARRP